MLPMGLDDHQLADVLSYVRSTYGNTASAVTVEQVAVERAATSGRTQPWSAKDLGH